MPIHLTARPPLDEVEERQVRKLVHSTHAPADWIIHAQIVAHSWDGLRTRQIAEELGCHPQTVRERLHAFTDRGVDGLGMKPGSGRKPRLTQLERSTILALVKLPPPGQSTYELTGELVAPDPDGEPEWTLDTLTAAAHVRGIQVARSQVRRIFRREGRPLAPHAAVGDQQGSRFCPKRAQIVALSTDPPAGATVVCVDSLDELGPVTPRNFPPASGWSADGHRIKVPLDYERGPDKVWVYGALCVRDEQVRTQTASARNTTTSRTFLETLDHAFPQGDLYLVADNLSSHSSGPIRDGLTDHPRIQHAFIPVGAAWLRATFNFLDQAGRTLRGRTTRPHRRE